MLASLLARTCQPCMLHRRGDVVVGVVLCGPLNRMMRRWLFGTWMSGSCRRGAAGSSHWSMVVVAQGQVDARGVSAAAEMHRAQRRHCCCRCSVVQHCAAAAFQEPQTSAAGGNLTRAAGKCSRGALDTCSVRAGAKLHHKELADGRVHALERRAGDGGHGLRAGAAVGELQAREVAPESLGVDFAKPNRGGVHVEQALQLDEGAWGNAGSGARRGLEVHCHGVRAGRSCGT